MGPIDNNIRTQTPAWVTCALNSFRADAQAIGVDNTQIDITVTWVAALAGGVAQHSAESSLADEWATSAELRSTVWAVAAHACRSASDVLAVIIEFSEKFDDTPLAEFAALDLRHATSVLERQRPVEAHIIGDWLNRIETIPAVARDIDVTKPAQATACWLDGVPVERDELDSAIASAGIRNVPLVIELDHCPQRFPIAVQHLADEACTASDAWCRDLASGTTAWFSRFGGWTPTD